MRRLVNPLVGAILRSPLHRVMSGGVILVTVTGRRSGHRYTTPVQYVRAGNDVFAVSRAGRTWWRNVRGGAAVTLRLHGRDRNATADVVPAAEVDAIRPLFEGSSLRRALDAADAVVIRAHLDHGG